MKNINNNQVSNIAGQSIAFEGLEGRQMFSVVSHHVAKPKAIKVVKPVAVVPVPAITMPLSINQTAGVLTVLGTTGNDQISISQSGKVFTIHNGSWSTTVTGTFTKLIVKGNGGSDSINLDASVTENADLYGAAGNDSITGGSGNDRIFAGAGANVINGGAGDDTIVTLGSTSDVVTGGLGNDSFWMDNNSSETITDLSTAENAAKHVHKISSFLGGVSTALNGQTFAEPATTDKTMTYKNFSNLSLFNAAGPSEDDIVQGYVGDCWYLSSLSSVAKTNADRIRQSVVDLGDGTYAVQFTKNGQNVFARVDGNLPTWYNQAAYANVVNGKGQSSLWVAIMEKAMTEFMGSTASYNNIDGGWMSTAYDSMGLSNTDLNAQNATDLVNQLAAATAANKAVTLGIGNVPAGAPLIGGHAYTVDHATKDAKGNVTSVTLRNPWGIDGAGNDGANDGYVTVTPAQLYAGWIGATTANV